MAISASLRASAIFLLLVVTGVSVAQSETTDPHITSWVTARSYARVYETSSDKTSGNAVSTWPRSGLTNGGGGQATVVYSDVQRVVYSTNYVYVYVTGLPSYTTGNWLTPNGMTYTSWPTNRGTIQKIPLTPSIPTTKQANHGSGGVLVNGVFVWANGDAQSYSTTTSTVSMSGQGIWNRLAGVAEAFNFDPAYGHQPGSGAYHNHINPIALRYQLGDNVTYNAATKVYSEGSTPTKHSPLIGWANDGLPIYGPYGYSSALDTSSDIRRMTSGFVKRDGTTTNKSTNQPNTNLASTGRTTLPVWSASVQGKSTTLLSTEYGPTTTTTYAVGGGVTSTYSIGVFAEDYDYLGDLGYTQGTDFDLNRQNVRYCKTPEFPNGTYAYFVCIDSSGATVFPDIINQEYFGSAAMGTGTVTSISETVTEYVRGGQASTIVVTATASGSGVKISWTSVEGGTYTVASSSDGTTYTTLTSSAASAGAATTYDTATQAPYYKVTLNALATYDTAGNGGVSGIGNSGSVYYPAGAIAPSITTQPAGTTVTTGAKVTLTVVATGTPTLTYQWRKNGDAITGATSATYVISSAKTTDAGTYSVTVTNAVDTVTSNDAALVVNEPVVAPSITTQPVGTTVLVGADVTFTVAATGTATLTYQWRKNGEAISGATSASYTISSAKTTDSGTYSVTVTNSANTATSNGAVLVVNAPVAPSITTQPVGTTVTAGAKVTLTVTATGTATLAYQWRKDGDAITGATSASYVILSTKTTDTGTYSVTVTNSVDSVTSNGAVLVVNEPVVAPSITTQPVGATITVGADVTFTVAATGTATLTYQWRKNGDAITGATGATYVISSAKTTDAGTYSVTVTNSANTATSNGAVLVVNEPVVPPSITTQPVGATVTAGTKVTLTVTATGTATLTYQWRKEGNAIVGATSASYVISSAKAADAGTYSVTVTNSANTATSNDAVLVVNEPLVAPVITTQPSSQTIAYGDEATFTVAATSTESVTYQWKKGGAPITGQTASSYSIHGVTFDDAGGYSVSVTNSVGSVTSGTATLTVPVPAPTITLEGSVPVGGLAKIDTTGGTSVVGVSYYATGLPAGLSLDLNTGQITGTINAATGTYTVTYWSQYGTVKSAVKNVQFVVRAFPSAMTGGFEGLLEDDHGLPAGKVALLVTSTGAFSGKLTSADAKSYTLKGTLALNADYSAGSATLLISRGTGVTPYSLAVAVSSGSGLRATLAGVGDTSTGVKLITYAKDQISPWAGAYTLTLSDLVNLGVINTVPEGDGYATATISSTGVMSIKGKLPDGTALTGSFAVGVGGSFRWYLKPYKTVGNYLAGWLSLTERTDQAGRYEATSSDFYWRKPVAPTDKAYLDGFGPLALSVDMQKWVAPTTTTSLGSQLGLAAAGGPLALTIDGAGLANHTVDANTHALPTSLSLNSTGLISVAGASNPTTWTIKVTAATGAFTGSFTLTDGSVSRKVSFQGVLLQLPSPGTTDVIGRGYFLLPPLVKTDPTLSGALEIVIP